MAHLVIPEDNPREVYSVGSTPTAGPFALPWPFFAHSDIRVWVGAQEAVMTELPATALQFKVAGIAEDGGFSAGTVTLGAAVADTVVIVQRAVPIKRLTDYPYPSPVLPIRELNTELDRIHAIMQQLHLSLSRTVRLRDEDPTAGLEIPSIHDRAGKFAAWNSLGQMIATTIDIGGGGALPPITPWAAELLGMASAAAARGQIGVADIIPLTSFAAGDGVTDDTDAIITALTMVTRGVLDGGGRTYRITRPVSAPTDEITVQNANFDMSAITGGFIRCMEFAGQQGAAVPVTGGGAVHSSVLSVASTATFSAGGYAWLGSTAWWDTAVNTTLGQIVRIKAVLGPTQVQIDRPLIYNYQIEGVATLSPLVMKRRIRFVNCHFRGGDRDIDPTTLLHLDKCLDCSLDRCSFADSYYSGVAFNRCYSTDLAGTIVRNMRMPGTGYGIVVGQGCAFTTIRGGYGEEVRHYMTSADNDGVNMHIAVANVTTIARDNAFDFHASADIVSVTGCTIEIDTDDYGGTADGILFAGLSCIIMGNTIRGANAAGITHHCEMARGRGTSIIANNDITMRPGGIGSNIAAIRVRNASTHVHDAVISAVIMGNRYRGQRAYGIHIHASDGWIETVAMAGNIAEDAGDAYCLIVQASEPYSVTHLSLGANTWRANGTAACLIGTSGVGGGGLVSVMAVAGDVIQALGGGNGFALNRVSGFTERGNHYNVAGQRISANANCTDISIDPQTVPALGVTSSSAAVPVGTSVVACSYAGTITLNLPPPAMVPRSTIIVRTTSAFAVNNATANITPITGGSPVVGILPAVSGAWAKLYSTGSGYIIIARGQ